MKIEPIEKSDRLYPYYQYKIIGGHNEGLNVADENFWMLSKVDSYFRANYGKEITVMTKTNFKKYKGKPEPKYLHDVIVTVNGGIVDARLNLYIKKEDITMLALFLNIYDV